MPRIVATLLDNGLESKLRLTSHYRYPIPGDLTLAVRRVRDGKGLDRVVVIDDEKVTYNETRDALKLPIGVRSRIKPEDSTAQINFTKELPKRVKQST
jgi:hypothetical protein